LRVPVATFDKKRKALENAEPFRIYGQVRKVVGLIIESSGPPARIGDICLIENSTTSHLGQENFIRAEVVGFRENFVLLMPFGEMTGVQAGNLVINTGKCLKIPVGETLLGRVLDGLGEAIDGKGNLDTRDFQPVFNVPPHVLERRFIRTPLTSGVRAIDGLLTCGEGQRVGIFSGSGIGKSTLLAMIARNSNADVNVIALVGERGREVREFIENDLGEEGLKKSVMVVATSEQPALVRIKAAFTATAIAEWFREKGKRVVLMMDSITRFAMAQREVGLAIGEPPSTKGYTPSVFALLPRLLERAGNSHKGSITAFYTILVEGDDTNEPIADATRAILDGHIVLDRKLSNRGHYPAIDPLNSLSRVMPSIVSEEHLRAASRFRELYAAYRDVEDLLMIGAYKTGTNPTADCAIERWEKMNAFLRQNKAERAIEFQNTVANLVGITNA